MSIVGTYSLYPQNTAPPPVTPTQQEVYDASPDGNVDLSSGKHQGYSSTTAVFYTPSMSNAQFSAVPSLPNGGIAWSIEDDRFNVNKGTAGTPNIDQLAYITDVTAVTNNEVFGEMYFTGNTTQTVIASTSTAVKVNATYTSGSLQEFGQSAGTLTYNALVTRTMTLKVSLTATPVTNTSNLTFFVYKTGAEVVKFTQSIDFDPTIPSQKSVTLSGTVSLATGDTIQIFVKNNTVVDNVLVGNLNCSVTSIGGVNEGAEATLETAYTSGDGTMTMTAGKPLELNSTSDSIIPTIQTNQIDTPTNGTVISNLIAFADGAQYGLLRSTATTVGQHSTNVWQGLSSGAPIDALVYTGSNKTLYSPNFMTLGSNSQGVNTTVATVTVPVESYGTGTGTFLMWSGINGTPVIPANTFGPGNTIEIDVTGEIHLVIPGSTVNTASHFNIVVGGIINVSSSNINTSTYPASFTGTFQWKFKIVRTPGTSNNNGLTISGSGFFTDTNGVAKPITFPSGVWTTLYTPSSTYTIAVNYVKGVSGGSGTEVDYIAWGLNIKQYS